MSFIPKPQEIYKHFKGNLYQITAVAEHTETGEMLVVYQALYGDFRTYARPLSMFTGRVDKEKYPDACQEFRFELQGPNAGRQRAETDGRAGLASEPESGGAESEEGPDCRSEAFKRPDSEPDALGEKRTPPQDGDAAEGEPGLDPLVLEFLDSSEYGQRLNILAALHHRITDDMITTMAIASGVEVGEGDIEQRFESLKNCLLTLEHYECRRLT